VTLGQIFKKKPCVENWYHSQLCVEVASRSRLFPQRRSARKKEAGKWNKKKKKKKKKKKRA